MNIENVELPVMVMIPVEPPPDEEEAPSSFPIDPIPDDTRSDEEAPASFPIMEPETDDSERGEEDRPLSFPIDPIPDDTGVKG